MLHGRCVAVVRPTSQRNGTSRMAAVNHARRR